MNVEDFRDTIKVIEIESVFPFEMRMQSKIIKARDMKAQK